MYIFFIEHDATYCAHVKSLYSFSIGIEIKNRQDIYEQKRKKNMVDSEYDIHRKYYNITSHFQDSVV
jgi:hypothetical protein